jgi:hypothetical protein
VYVRDGGHDHDDCGSFQIMKNNQIITGDVGGGIFYEGNWNDRFNRPIFNSYSHPVPVIDGQLQIRSIIYYKLIENQFRDVTGDNKDFLLPKVLKTNFSNEFDEITFDLKAAYNCSSLLSLNRTNIFKREFGKNQVIIIDNAEFTKPTNFEIAIATRGNIYGLSKKGLQTLSGNIMFQNVTLQFIVTSYINSFKYKIQKQSMNGISFERLGILVNGPVKTAKIKVLYF